METPIVFDEALTFVGAAVAVRARVVRTRVVRRAALVVLSSGLFMSACQDAANTGEPEPQGVSNSQPTAQPQAAGIGGPGTSQPGGPTGAGPNDAAPSVATDSTGARGPEVSGPGVAGSGATWCDAKRVLQSNCGSCHGAEPAFGAPMSLASHGDLMAAAPSDGRQTLTVALERIDDSQRPMPPTPNPRLSASDRTVLTTWAAAGAPEADCGDEVATPATGDPDCIDCGDYSCKDGTPMRFTAHGQPTPKDDTPYDASQIGGAATFGDPNSYQCFYFKAPWAAGDLATGFRPVIDNTRILHHWLLYASENAPFDLSDGMIRGECQLQSDPNRVLLGGWAPGTPGRNYPEDVGQELPFGPNTYITLEIHYFNAMPGEPALDRSGGELCVTKSPRTNVATQHWLGTENIQVPARGMVDAGDMCTPNLTGDQTSTLLAVTPHMHAIGSHAKLELLRADGTIEILHDAPFTFDNQTTYMLDPPVIVNAQDRLRATCTFTNPNETPVTYGDGTNEEMCYLFVTAYPAGSLHNGRIGCWGPFCGPGSTRRCIDNESLAHIATGL